jgi:hypothetical protein
MPARRRLVASAVIATAALSPLAVAHAAKIPTIDEWTGKTHKKADGIFIDNVRGTKAVSIQITVNCVSTTGAKTPTAFSATGKLSGGRVSVTNRRAGDAGVPATLTVRSSLPTSRAAVGTVSWRQGATNQLKACVGSDTFKLKHSIGHGG